MAYDRCVHEFTLDFRRPTINRLQIVDGDTANTFEITLEDRGNAVTLDATLHKVVAIFTRADGEVCAQDEDTDVSFTADGVVTIDVYSSSFRTGVNNVKIQLYKRTNASDTTYPLLLTTYEQQFQGRSRAIPESGAAPSEPQMPMLEKYVQAAKSWAVGGTGVRDGENTDNAMYFKTLAEQAVQGGIIDPTFLTWLTAHMSDFITAIGNDADAWLDEHITNPSNPPLDTSLSLANAAAPANLLGFLVNYLGASVYRSDKNTATATYNAIIKSTGNIVKSTDANTLLTAFPVEANKLYVLYGTSVRVSAANTLAVFSTSLFDGETTLTGNTIIVPNTTATVATDYNVVYRPTADGYIYIYSYGSYGKLELYDGVYRSATLDNISVSTKPSESYDVSFDDIFNQYESSYIDDFTARESFVDTDHPYTILGSDADAPTITTGIGATRTGASGMAGLAYSRTFGSFPYVCLIGRVASASMIVKVFDDSNNITVGAISIGRNGGVSYNSVAYGSIHINAAYVVLVVNSDSVTVYDDSGIEVRIPVSYTSDKPMNIALCFGAIVDRLYGYGSFVEFVKRPMQMLDFNKCIIKNMAADSASVIKSVIRFSHGVWNSGAINTFYFTPDANPYMEDTSTTFGLSNNPCIRCIADYAEDYGYRTEIGVTPIKTSLDGKLGALQRIHASADYYMPSAQNLGTDDFYTYIFQIHDSGFTLQGWTDGPPLALRVKSGRLSAHVCYIDDGAVPQSDNRHTVDAYDLCDWEMDKWHRIEVEARIGWRNVLAPRLIVCVDGIERLNIETPLGYNIVTSGGYVNTHWGVYTPEWHDRTFEHTHAEIYVTNIHWEGTQNVN